MDTVAEVAVTLNTSKDTVLRLIRAGELKAVNVSAGTERPQYRVPRAALDEFMAKRASGQPSVSAS